MRSTMVPLAEEEEVEDRVDRVMAQQPQTLLLEASQP